MNKDFQDIADIARVHHDSAEALHTVGSQHHTPLLPNNTARKLKTGKLKSVIFYSPEELVVSVQSGVKMDELHNMLREKQQQLCARPRNLSGMSGNYSPMTTIGGAISMGLSGSNRVNHYGLRDMLLGIGVINGRGECVRAGGRVFKNVTGYDWGKLLVGAQGSLGVITDLQLRLMPLPPTEVSVSGTVADSSQAATVMTRALSGPWDVTGAAAVLLDDHSWQLVLRLQGLDASVRQRQNALQQALSAHWSEGEGWQHQASALWWEQHNDLRLFDQGNNRGDVWLLTHPAAQASAVTEYIRYTDARATIVWDWGGTQIWCATGQAWQADALQDALAPYRTRVRPIRVADPSERYLPSPDAVQRKILGALYQQFDPHAVFSASAPYAFVGNRLEGA